jgi:hypothetical protein
MVRRNNSARSGAHLAVAAGILLWPDALIAQASQTDVEVRIPEPIITEETMPNEPGDWDLRMSGSYGWQGSGGAGFLPRAQLFFGIVERWGAEVELPMAFANGATGHYGFGDVSMSLKYLVRKPGVTMPGIVLGLETTFPSGNAGRGLGEGVFEVAPFVAFVHASPWIVLQGNSGYSVFHRTQVTEATNQMFYNGAVIFPVERLKTCLVWEINGTHAPNGNRAALSSGLKYSFNPERYLAIAMPVGLNSGTPRVGIVLQLQIAVRSAEK